MVETRIYKLYMKTLNKLVLILFLITFNSQARYCEGWASKTITTEYKSRSVKCYTTTRGIVLERDLRNLEIDGCKIVSGTYAPVYYEGAEIKVLPSKNIDIDHVLPSKFFDLYLKKNVMQDIKKEICNDEENLIASFKKENQEKSDWVCGIKDKPAFTNKITKEKYKELCEKQREFCEKYKEYFIEGACDKIKFID